MPKVKNLDEVVYRLKAHLPDYLEEHGIPTNKNFSCPNPSHTDSDPSASVNKKGGGTYGVCFGCGTSFDIFTIAGWLDGLPTEGPDWIEVTVQELAKKYEIDIEFEAMTEAEKYTYAVHKAYEHVAGFVADPKIGTWSSEIKSYIKKRKWTPKKLQKFGVGVLSRDELMENMLKIGYTADYLRKLNLISDSNQVIDEGTLVFTIRDHRGKVVSFSTRCFGDAEKKHKYNYVSTAGLEYPFPSKGNILYNLNEARKHKDKPLWLFEGYGDCISTVLGGMENAAAMQGAFLNANQADMIERLGFRSVILAADFDEPGQTSIAKILKETFKGRTGLRVSILAPVDDYKDPGELVEKKGIEALENARVISSFDWYLERELKRMQPSEYPRLATDMTAVIANEPNAITRDIQMRRLAEVTNVSVYAIEQEVRKLVNKTEAEIARQEDIILDSAMRDINFKKEDKVNALTSAIGAIEELHTQHRVGKFSPSSCIVLLDEEKEFGDNADPDTPVGFDLPLLPDLEKCFSGGKDWSKNTLMCLGGMENCGKSSLMSYIAMNIVATEKDDTVSIYHSIDDSARDILPKFIAGQNTIIQGKIPDKANIDLPIGSIINPAKWRAITGMSEGAFQGLLKRREKAYKHVRNLMEQEKLILKDSHDGTSLRFVDACARYYRERYPSKRIMILVDNASNLSDYPNRETRDRYTRIADDMNNICNRYSVCMLASVEYRKYYGTLNVLKKPIPSNDDLAETRAFKYRAKWIGHIYNDMHVFPEEYDVFHEHPYMTDDASDALRLPRLLLVHAKTKINGFKGASTLDFYPAISSFAWKNEKEAKQEAKEYRQSVKEGTDPYDSEDEDW